jgi:hypothetical protein
MSSQRANSSNQPAGDVQQLVDLVDRLVPISEPVSYWRCIKLWSQCGADRAGLSLQ